MTSSLQTFLALTFVALALIGFVWRWWKQRQKPGCGGGCGCPSSGDKIKKLHHKK